MCAEQTARGVADTDARRETRRQLAGPRDEPDPFIDCSVAASICGERERASQRQWSLVEDIAPHPKREAEVLWVETANDYSLYRNLYCTKIATHDCRSRQTGRPSGATAEQDVGARGEVSE